MNLPESIMTKVVIENGIVTVFHSYSIMIGEHLHIHDVNGSIPFKGDNIIDNIINIVNALRHVEDRMLLHLCKDAESIRIGDVTINVPRKD